MNEARRETVVPAPVEDTWAAITESEWLGEDAEIELAPGGDVSVRDGDSERHGFVEEVDAPRRLVFWWSEQDSEATRVQIELSPEDDGTRVLVVETRPLAVLGTAPERSGPVAIAA